MTAEIEIIIRPKQCQEKKEKERITHLSAGEGKRWLTFRIILQEEVEVAQLAE